MYCKNCGKEVNQNAAVCLNCGVMVGMGNKFCPQCGFEPDPLAVICVKCGRELKKINNMPPQTQPEPSQMESNQPEPSQLANNQPKTNQSEKPVEDGFLNSIRSCFTKYATFKGRASRSEYWHFTLFTFLLMLVPFILQPTPHPEYIRHLEYLIEEGRYYEYLELYFHNLPALYYIISIVTFLPSLAVLVRRLHDTGKSGAFCLVSVIPIVGAIILLANLCMDSDSGENEYGPNPKGV